MSTITTINAADQISASRTVINTNFANLNADKVETSVIDTDTTMAANSDAKIPSQKAVKAYVDGVGVSNATTTARGLVEIATQAQVDAGTALGETGASIVVTPETLKAVTSPIVRTYLNAGSPHTWSKPAGLKYVVVEVQAAGGGGAGTDSTTNNVSKGCGGGGGYARKLILANALGATETVTVNAPGTAGTTTTAGGAGGSASFGSIVSATGGEGGTVSSSGVGGLGGNGSGGDVNCEGGDGSSGGSSDRAGVGGGSVLGGGGRTGAGASFIGQSGNNYGGGGGSGFVSGANQAAGGAGGPGIVIVTEYYV